MTLQSACRTHLAIAAFDELLEDVAAGLLDDRCAPPPHPPNTPLLL